jgi:hypothetical protein
MTELELEASLADRELPDLVQLLQEDRFSGLLSLHRGSVAKHITLEAGRLVFATSSDPDDRLGVQLLRKGRLSLRQLVAAGRRVAPGKRFGTILVEDGVLSPKDLVRAVVEHTEQIAYSAFTWSEGHYKLEAGQREAEAITLNIDTPRLILGGIRRIESWRRIDRAVGGLEAVYRVREGHGAIVDRLDLDVTYGALVDVLQRPHSVEQLCTRSSLSSFEICRSLWAFRVLGIVERTTEPAVASALDDEGLGLVLPQD